MGPWLLKGWSIGRCIQRRYGGLLCVAQDVGLNTVVGLSLTDYQDSIFKTYLWRRSGLTCLRLCFVKCDRRSRSWTLQPSDSTFATKGHAATVRHYVTVRCHAFHFCTCSRFQCITKHQFVTDSAGSSGNASGLHSAAPELTSRLCHQLF
jgi:hypothetical protein